jgi:hypothetical protein
MTVALGACSSSATHLEISAFHEGGTPLAGIEITALPFDAEHLLDSLTRRSNAPKPAFAELEAAIATYRRPDASELHEIGTAWRATRDSVARLADSLGNVSPDSPGYGAAYERLRQQYRRLAQRAVERDAAFRDQIGEDRNLALWATAAADSLRAWERSAYADFPNLADSAIARSGRTPVTGETDEQGRLELELHPGEWWIVTRLPDRENPFIERYWNVAVVVTSFGPARLPLYERNSSERWRH